MMGRGFRAKVEEVFFGVGVADCEIVHTDIEVGIRRGCDVLVLVLGMIGVRIFETATDEGTDTGKKSFIHARTLRVCDLIKGRRD